MFEAQNESVLEPISMQYETVSLLEHQYPLVQTIDVDVITVSNRNKVTVMEHCHRINVSCFENKPLSFAFALVYQQETI